MAGHARHRPDPGSERQAEDARWRRGLIGADDHRSLIDDARSQRTWTSRALHHVGEATSHAWAGLLVAMVVIAWFGVGVAVRFPSWWQATLYSVGAAVTLIMVFALQHTQARQQSATQRKLDELLRALPRADQGLMAVEEAPDEELEALAGQNLETRREALRRRDTPTAG